MRFPSPLIEARLIRRYKRFLADVELAGGEIVTVHCANPGAMAGLTAPGARVLLSRSANLKRKLPLSWEMIETETGLVGINTALPNRLAEEAILAGAIPGLAGYAAMKREVRYGRNSRIDILLTEPGRPDTYVEVKNVHFLRQTGLAEFPDSVTARGAKHLAELSDAVAAGHRAVMVYMVQRGDADRLAIADDMDPAYAAAFDLARAAGVEMLACRCALSAEEIVVDGLLPVVDRP
ncbi:DNA/RNA nuclease SfsA [Bauldia litoralis]|uniref:DNA/RNA nuclease SfsA n=1 Tax=Bauldia litoralis TaxID=665467 RepID=UPI0032666665